MKPRCSSGVGGDGFAACARQARPRFSPVRRRLAPLAPALCAAAVVALVSVSRAAVITRVGGNNDWVDGPLGNGNWIPADEPDADDTAVLDSANTVKLADSNAGSELFGTGAVNFVNAYAAPSPVLTNDGTLRAGPLLAIGLPPAGTMTLTGTGNCRFDLDGTGALEIGVVTVMGNQTLDINATLADPFRGDLNLCHRSVIDMSASWTLDGGTVSIGGYPRLVLTHPTAMGFQVNGNTVSGAPVTFGEHSTTTVAPGARLSVNRTDGRFQGAVVTGVLSAILQHCGIRVHHQR